MFYCRISLGATLLMAQQRANFIGDERMFMLRMWIALDKKQRRAKCFSPAAAPFFWPAKLAELSDGYRDGVLDDLDDAPTHPLAHDFHGIHDGDIRDGLDCRNADSGCALDADK